MINWLKAGHGRNAGRERKQMGLFRRKKDPRVEEITAWASNYLREREEGNGAEGSVLATASESPETDRVVAKVEDITMESETSSVTATVATVPRDMESLDLDVADKPPVTEDLATETAAEEIREEIAEPEVAPPPSLFQRLRAGLARTRDGLVGRIDLLLAGRSTIDGDTLEALEEILIESDIGVQQVMTLISRIQDRVEKKDLKDPQLIKGYIRDEITNILSHKNHHLSRPAEGPFVIMVVGVNGVGKTTTIAKLARRFSEAGESVLLAAGDTFRAAATEQLEIWGKRVGADVIKHQSGADPSAVIFDALKAADARGTGVVIADTAGRLHTKVNLMEELKKMKRVMAKVMPEAPHEILLVLDATTGQNALSQAKIFHEAVGVTGIALTKLDGTAKGGIVTAIVGELGIPVKLIGIGEGMDDLRDFEPQAFVGALFDG